MSSQGSTLALGVHAVGLIGFYSGYGLLQERIMKGEYGPERAHFGSSSLLVLLNRLFAMFVGVAILAYKSWSSDAPTFRSRLVPRSPLYAYAAVAACNFLSTSCQYEALKHVSFTTQSLAKCAKMVPVLLVGTLIYKKSHKAKQWISAGVVTVGCGIYLVSNPPTSKHGVATSDVASSEWFSAMMGTILLLGYLFFDGLTSTTQERVFGKSASSSDPFGPQSPVLDQMLYVNFFAVVISIFASALSSVSGSLAPSVWLLMNSSALVIDVLLLSATAALGLIVLLNTIASFGALTSSTIMTCRQFLSILINAGAFGNFTSVGSQGWLGVGLVASGIWIKMDPRYREKKPSLAARNADIAAHGDLSGMGKKGGGYGDEKVVFDADEEAREGLLPRVAVLPGPPSTPMTPYPVSPDLAFQLGDGANGEAEVVRETRKVKNMRLFKQYGVPVLVPAVIALLMSPFTSGGNGDIEMPTLSSISSYIPNFGSHVLPVGADPAEDITSTGIVVTESLEEDVEADAEEPPAAPTPDYIEPVASPMAAWTEPELPAAPPTEAAVPTYADVDPPQMEAEVPATDGYETIAPEDESDGVFEAQAEADAEAEGSDDRRRNFTQKMRKAKRTPSQRAGRA